MSSRLASAASSEPDAPTRSGRVSGGWLVAGAVAAGAVGVLLATARYGIGLTPDSVTYITGARSLADGDGYVSIGGAAIGNFPPGYSSVLSLAERLGLDAIDFARILSIVTLATSIVLGYMLLRRHVRSAGVRTAATILLGCSAVLLEVYSKALSEHIFVPVVVAFLLVAERLMERPFSAALMAVAAALSWAAFYLRYAGIVTVAIGVLVIVIGGWPKGVTRSVLRAAGFALLAVSVPALWAYRNQQAVGDPFGKRASASSSLYDNVYGTFNEISQWLATDVAPAAARALVAAAVLLLVGWAVLAVARRKYPVPDDTLALLPIALFIAVYIVYFTLSTSVVAIAPVNTRLTLPLYIPSLVLGAWLFERVRSTVTSSTVATAMSVVGIAFVAANVAWFVGRAVNTGVDGAGGYATERWHESELIDELDDLDFAQLTYSNDPTAIAIFTGDVVRSTPDKRRFQSEETTDDLDVFLRNVACADDVHVIWFEPGGRPYRYTLDELQGEVSMQPILEASDGTIFAVTARQSVPC